MPLGHFAWKAGSRFSRYEILGRLSAGGMAEVWRARVLGVESFQKDIVIKTMRPELADTPDLVRMFINEAEIAARMNHPGIVQVFDFGQYEARYFIAMEYVPGRSLRQLGRSFRLKQRRLPRTFFLRTMIDVVRALSYGHALVENGAPLGFVHRDVSPENVMVSYAGATKLIDFGAAATAHSPPPSSSVVGKLRYLSPERLRGNVGDARSDLYSVGIMLYEYLTGASPFDGQDMVKKIIEGQVPDILTKINLPPAAARVVRRAMAADLRKRYGWADRLADELQALLSTDLGHDPYGANESDVLELLRRAGAAPYATPLDGDSQTPRLRVLPSVSVPAPTPPPAPKGTPDRTLTPPPPRAAPTSASPVQARPVAPPPDPFAVVRKAGVNPVAAWFRGQPPEVALPPPATAPHQNEDEAVAAACFERGLALLSERRPLDAVLYWERAVALAPTCAMYQENLRRLITQIRDREELAGPPTPPPTRTGARKED
jgi:eukaryotic-like serine/threonine-protein kinase